MSEKIRKVSEKNDSYNQLVNEFNDFKKEVLVAQNRVNYQIDLINDTVKRRIFKLYDEIDNQVERIKLEINEWSEEFSLEKKINLNILEREMLSIKRKLQSFNLLNQYKYNIDDDIVHLKEKLIEARKQIKPFKMIEFNYELLPIINDINFGSLVREQPNNEIIIKNITNIVQKELGLIIYGSNGNQDTVYVKRPLFTNDGFFLLRFEFNRKTSKMVELLKYDYEGSLISKKEFKCSGKLYSAILTDKYVFTLTEIKEKSISGQKHYDYVISVFDHNLKLVNYSYLEASTRSFEYDFVFYDPYDVYLYSNSHGQVLVCDEYLTIKRQFGHLNDTSHQFCYDNANSNELCFTDNLIFLYKDHKAKIISRLDGHVCKTLILKHTFGPISFTDNFIYHFESSVLENILLKIDLSGNIVDKLRLDLPQEPKNITSMIINDKLGLVTLWIQDEIIIAKI